MSRPNPDCPDCFGTGELRVQDTSTRWPAYAYTVEDCPCHLDGVDGSDIDRVVNELIARGGADATLGRFLRDKISEHNADVDSEICVGVNS